MKKHFLISLVLASLFGAIAVPSAAAKPPDLVAPPTSDRVPSSVNPFLDTLLVTLDGGGNQVYYDENNPKDFDLSNARLYTPGSAIVLSATTILRAVAYNELLGQSETVSWQYSKDAAPTVAFATPANGQVFHIGNMLTLTSTVTDPDGPGVPTVNYFSSTAGGAWQALVPVTGANFKYEVVIPAGTASGTVGLRAVATDGRGLTGTKEITITIENQAPIARAGVDAFLTLPNNSLQLNGSTSSDPDDPGGTTLKYEWTGAGATFTGANTATPTATFAGTGIYTLTLKVTDQGVPALSSTDQVQVSVYSKPAITSAGTATGPASAPFSYTLTATGYPTPVLAATGLPPWLSFAPSTGVLSGTPPATGSFTVSLSAANDAGNDAKSLIITIGGALAPPVITSPLSAGGPAGVAFSYTLTATGNPVPALGASGLPPWLSFNANTNVLSGLPPAAGSFSVNLTASNSQGNDGKTLAITIGAALTKPVITSPLTASATAALPFTYTLTASGNPAPTLSVTGLPSWLAFNASTGVLSGTPTAAGNVSITLKAANSQGNVNKTLVITIGEALAAPAINSSLNASGAAKLAFSYTMTASGNPAPTLGATGGPAWISFNAGTGVLSGTPPAKGTFTVSMTAANSQGSDAKTLNISISDSTIKPTFTNPGVSPLNFPGKTGTAFTYGLTATGTSPITFTSSTLPAGLTLTGSLISGSPTASGTFPVTVTATNAFGVDTRILNLIISADPKITVDLDTGITVLEKSKVSFSVTATGYPAVTYQWQFGGSATGAFANTGPNAATYNIDSVSSNSAGYYRVIVKNGAGPDVTSKVRHLTVKPLPLPIRIVSQPVAVTAIVGEKVKFVSRATGEPDLMYQWFKGATSLGAPAKDDSVYDIAAAAVGQGGQYRVRVTNAQTDDTKPATYAFSDSAKLTVQEPKLLKPTAKPAGGAFYPSVNVVLAHEVSGTDIYYTVNGDDPTQSSAKFGPGDTIRISATTTVKAKAYKTGYRASDAMSETYTYTVTGKVAKPAIKPLAPNFQNSLLCSLSTTTGGADVYYTTNGSSPLEGNPAKFTTPFTISATTTIIAVGRKSGMQDSDTLKMVYTLDKNPSKVLTPKISPPGGTFSTPFTVTLSNPADTAAELWYTLDGSSPDTSHTRTRYANVPIPVSRTAMVKEIAIRPGFLNSDIVIESYEFIPGPVLAQPNPGVFDSMVTVKLSALPAGAVIRYVLDGMPTIADSVFPPEGLVLKTTNTVSAIAVMDGVVSAVYSFGYTLKGGPLSPPNPTTTNNRTTFKDSLRIWLAPPTDSATMYYTKNGSAPTTHSTKYTGPIDIDTTTTLQVIAVQTGFENSRPLVATYTLIPETPTISPIGGSAPTAIYPKILSSSKRATLCYTTDGREPTPATWKVYTRGDSIPIQITSDLKAVAVAGNYSSPVRTESYTIFGDIELVLKPGVTSSLPGQYSMRIPEDKTANILMRIANTGSLHLAGFEGVQYGMILGMDPSQGLAGSDFPGVTFTSSSSDDRSMYKVDLSGKVFFISSADTVTLTQAGTYFMGIDISPPVVTYISESFDEKDSTRVSFHIEDNIANLSYDLKRNDDPKKDTNGVFIFSGTDLSVKLKHPPGTLKPLYIQLIVSDYKQPAFFPPDAGTFLSLSQRMGPLNGPASWTIGAANSPYDFISIPLALDPPMTLKDLRTANPNAVIEGADWNYVESVYQPLDAGAILKPGQGFWLGSRTRISSLSMPSATTLPSGSGTFSVVLHHGWNQIGNPHLEELYWPYSRNLGDVYKSFPIKGLWEYSSEVVNYVETESLKPWRGYYVYNFLEETVVPLSPRPITILSMKKESAVDRINVSLGWGVSRVLRLGADGSSSDGLGMEDEFSLPQRNRGLVMSAMRQGRALSSDWVRLSRNGIQEWKVALDGSGDSLPPLKILGQDLPEGYETWAVSPARSMKFKIETGKEIPASGLARDTLMIYSGPKDKMARFSRLQNMALAAAPLDLRVSARNGGFTMFMTLPSKAKFRATVLGLDGKRKGEFALGPLSEGFYRFAWESDFRTGGKRLAPGMYFLSLEIQGAGLNSRLSRKIVLSD